MDHPATIDRRFHPLASRKTSSGVAYRMLGDGAPIVLLHGGAGDWRHWVHSVDALATRFRVLAFDLPNYGDSAGFGWDIETDAFLDILFDAVSDAVGQAPKIHFAGFSFGGYLSAQMAVRFGQRTASLSMTGGAGYGPPQGRPFTLDSRKRMAERLGREPTPDEIWNMQAENLAKLMLWDRTKIDDWAIEMQVSNVARTRFDSRRLSWADGTPELIGQLSCPVLVAYGERDAAAIPPISERIARCRAARPDVQTEIIADCGHWAMYEAPQVVNPLLLDFHRGAT